MALATTVFGGSRYERHSDASAANTILTLAVPSDIARRLLAVVVKYSAAPTQAGVTVELDSGLGAAYDATLHTGTANAQTTVYQPSEPLIIAPGDGFKVTAPAGGAGITSQVSVYTEVI